MLIKIGDVATQYEVSGRTLRYWEDAGILTSVRMENGYRYYTESTLIRIQQIVMLRKLNVSIKDIATIFSTPHLKTVITILEHHLKTIQLEISDLNRLLRQVEQLIQQVKQQSDDVALSNALQDILSERKMKMTQPSVSALLNDVRIVKLPKMVFACYRAESSSPEEDCWNVLNQFILEHKLLEQYGFRHFGFNNPDPTQDSPVYGYEMWVTIPLDLAVPSPLYKREFAGGIFGAIPTYMTEIGERWGSLWQWALNNEKYEVDWDIETDRRCLEECIDYQQFNDPKIGPEEKQLDLLVPIRLK